MAKPWAKAFYNSAAWRVQKTREAYMVSKHGLCERCGKPGLIVHHRKALRHAGHERSGTDARLV